jgi:hypothetical protein
VEPDPQPAIVLMDEWILQQKLVVVPNEACPPNGKINKHHNENQPRADKPGGHCQGNSPGRLRRWLPILHFASVANYLPDDKLAMSSGVAIERFIRDTDSDEIFSMRRTCCAASQTIDDQS